MGRRDLERNIAYMVGQDDAARRKLDMMVEHDVPTAPMDKILADIATVLARFQRALRDRA